MAAILNYLRDNRLAAYFRALPNCEEVPYEEPPGALIAVALAASAVALAIFHSKYQVLKYVAPFYSSFFIFVVPITTAFAYNLLYLKKPMVRIVYMVAAFPISAVITALVARSFEALTQNACDLAILGGWVGLTTTVLIIGPP